MRYGENPYIMNQITYGTESGCELGHGSFGPPFLWNSLSAPGHGHSGTRTHAPTRLSTSKLKRGPGFKTSRVAIQEQMSRACAGLSTGSLTVALGNLTVNDQNLLAT